MNCSKIAVKAIKRKDRAKIKAKVKTKAKKSKRNFFCYDVNYNIRSNLNFVPYNGPRWKIPSGIATTESIKYKFQKLEIYSIKQVFRQLKHESMNNIYSRIDLSFDSHFSKLPYIRAYLTSLKDREANEWKRVASIYSALFKVVKFMNKLVFARRVKICMKKQINVEDIVTMEVPKRPVYVINYPERCTYVYEVDTMRRSINTKLLMSDWMFETPHYPINPLSNEPFTTGQLLSIYNQMKAYGSFSWVFDRFKACSFNLKLFKVRFKQQLKLEAIESHFKNEPENSKETIFDLFESNAINYGISDSNIEKFKTFYNLYPNSSYNIKFKPLVMHYYIAVELNDLPTLSTTSFEIKKIIDRYLNNI
jgi:hypothetical protein